MGHIGATLLHLLSLVPDPEPRKFYNLPPLTPNNNSLSPSSRSRLPIRRVDNIHIFRTRSRGVRIRCCFFPRICCFPEKFYGPESPFLSEHRIYYYLWLGILTTQCADPCSSLLIVPCVAWKSALMRPLLTCQTRPSLPPSESDRVDRKLFGTTATDKVASLCWPCNTSLEADIEPCL